LTVRINNLEGIPEKEVEQKRLKEERGLEIIEYTAEDRESWTLTEYY
jgi:hypothetical protein